MAEKRGGLFVPQGQRAIASVDTTPPLEIPGIESLSYEAGARESDTTNAMEGDSTVLGAPTIEPVTFTLSSYMPHMPIFRVIDKAYNDITPLNFSIRTQPAQVYPASDTFEGTTTQAEQAIAIAPGTGDFKRFGGLTFCGTEMAAAQAAFATGAVQRGHVLKIGTAYFVVVSIDLDADGSLSTFAPATGTKGVRVQVITAAGENDGSDVSAVSAGAFAVIAPGIQMTFAARIESSPSFTLGAAASAPLASTLNVRPLETIRRPSLHFEQNRAKGAAA